jgi:maleate isomerase
MSGPRRVGLIVPSSNTTMETELPAMLARRSQVSADEHFTFHSARMRMREVTPAALAAMNAESSRATAELADLRPDVVATACLVAIMAEGPAAHYAAEAKIASELEHAGVEASVVSSAGALIDALHHLGAGRIAIVTPYRRELTDLVVSYIEDTGIEVHDSLSLEVADNRAVGMLDPEGLKEHWRRLDLSGCDALVLSACVQMPSLSVIPAVEQSCGLPTLSAATATAWGLLRALNLDPTLPDAGRLLTDRS